MEYVRDREGDIEVAVNARDGDQVVGRIWATHREFPYDDVPEGRHYAEVRTLAVAPRYRRRGIGAALLHEVLDWADDYGYTHVSVEASARNSETDEFYLSAGFTPRSVIYDVEV